MSTTSVSYGQHPRRTAVLVALVVASLPAVPPHRTSPVEPSGAGRYENPGAMAQGVPRTAGLGSARAVARSAPGASSPGPGP
jgi:hypothetical protein